MLLFVECRQRGFVQPRVASSHLKGQEHHHPGLPSLGLPALYDVKRSMYNGEHCDDGRETCRPTLGWREDDDGCDGDDPCGGNGSNYRGFRCDLKGVFHFLGVAGKVVIGVKNEWGIHTW